MRPRVWRTFPIFVVVVLAVVAAPASAATIAVDITGDEVMGDSNCSIREAVNAARTDMALDGCAAGAPGEDTITLPAGTIVLDRDSPHEDANVTGDVDVWGGGITIQGAGRSSTILEGYDDRSFDVLAGGALELRDLAVTGGELWSTPSGSGGGIRNAGALRLLRVDVTGNHAGTHLIGGPGSPGAPGWGGGGIASSGTLLIEDSSIEGNSAGSGDPGTSLFPGLPGNAGGDGGDGGGLLITSGSATLTDVAISANNAGDGGAGGMGHVAMTGGAGGAGGSGGGIYVAGGTLTIAGVTLDGNQAGDGGDGGAGGLGGVGAPGAVGGAGSDGGSGGAIAVGGGSVSVTNATVASNQAGDRGDGGLGGAHGGGGAPAPDGTVGMGGDGGGFAWLAGTATFTHTTLSGNAPGAGGAGASAAGALTLRSSVAVGGCHAVTNGGGNVSFPGGSCGTVGDPLLGPLQDNGGATQTMALGTGSAAIDLVHSGSGCPAADQRGTSRPQGTGCDAGAFEVEQATTTPPTGGDGGGTATTTTPPASPPAAPVQQPPPLRSVRISRNQRGTRITGRIVVTRDGSTARIDLLAASGGPARMLRVGRLTMRNRSAGTVRFKVGLTRKGLNTLERRGKLRLTVRVTVISGNDRSTARRKVTLKRPAKRGR